MVVEAQLVGHEVQQTPDQASWRVRAGLLVATRIFSVTQLVGFNQLDQFRWTWEVNMTRVTIGLLLLLLVLSISGCTWTETYRDYPPSIGASEGYQHHEYHQADG